MSRSRTDPLTPAIPHGVGKEIIDQMADGQARIVRRPYLKSMRSIAQQMGALISVRPYRGDKYHMKRIITQLKAA